MSCLSRNHSQRGAALLIVLLLTATLAFVAIAITETVALSAARSINERSRSESLWLAFGAETLAAAALRAFVNETPGKLAKDDPWASEPIISPLEDAEVRLAFADATRCFNLNRLAQEGADAQAAKAEFILLAAFFGIGSNESDRVAQSIADWVDEDDLRGLQGAEDSYYTSLDNPYRTGGVNIADVSELRAMRAIDSERYNRMKSVFCAYPDKLPSVINVNMLNQSDAPVLAAALTGLLNRSISLDDAERLIAAYPERGYTDLNNFCAQPPINANPCPSPISNRLSLTSNYVTAHAEIVYNSKHLNMTTMFKIDGATVVMLRRRIGDAE